MKELLRKFSSNYLPLGFTFIIICDKEKSVFNLYKNISCRHFKIKYRNFYWKLRDIYTHKTIINWQIKNQKNIQLALKTKHWFGWCKCCWMCMSCETATWRISQGFTPKSPWQQQAGTTPYTVNMIIQLLKGNFNLIILKSGYVTWPPRSCDLILLRYFFSVT